MPKDKRDAGHSKRLRDTERWHTKALKKEEALKSTYSYSNSSPAEEKQLMRAVAHRTRMAAEERRVRQRLGKKPTNPKKK